MVRTPTVAYDANGNTLTDPSGKSYTWDFENRLTQVVNPGVGTTAFRYDPFGRRIQKSGPLGTTNYLYDGMNVLEEVDNAGSILVRYSQRREMDQPLAELRSGTASYYEADGLGSITSLSNSAGALANTYSYDSFGNLTASSGTLANPFQYTGREFDSETGIYEYRARSFDPSTGRFVSEDPLRFKMNPNFYPYAVNAPTRFNDPLGLSTQDVQAISAACQKCTDQLTQSGERLGGSGWWNGELNNAAAAIGWGNHYSGCDRQANLTSICLDSHTTPYDDHWTFSPVSVHWGLHRVTLGTSSNPSDPAVVCDSWMNTSTTIPKR
jgi:RHS repeat-associated protein